MNSLLWFLLVKSLLVFLCFVGLKFPIPVVRIHFFILHKAKIGKSKTELGLGQFQAPNERREGRSESKGLIRIKSGVAGRLRGKATRRTRQTEPNRKLWSVCLVFLGLTYSTQGRRN